MLAQHVEKYAVVTYDVTYVALETDDIITMSQHVVRHVANMLQTCLPDEISEPANDTRHAKIDR